MKKNQNKSIRSGSLQDISNNNGFHDFEDSIEREYGPYSSLRSMGNAYWQDTNRRSGPHFGKGPKGYQRADERIKEDVCEALLIHTEIDATEVEGEHISGVSDVKNDLRILTSVEGAKPGWGAEIPSRSVLSSKRNSHLS